MNEITPIRPLRVRHQNGARLLHVSRVETLTPRMRRIVLAGASLAGFVSAAADDHVKLFLPAPGQDRPILPMLGPNGPVFPQGAARPIGRDYTPRRFDAAACELTIDFVLHGDGPATSWAAQASPGKCVGIGGPRGSFLTNDDAGTLLLLAGDETALPAIARRLEELPPGARAIALIEVADEAEQMHLPSAASTAITWLFRDGRPAGDPALLLAALRQTAWPTGDLHAWMAGEIGTVRALRTHLLTERGLSRDRVHASGYWKHGEAGAHTKVED
jgi:NADPH-dependent ferric siderophore reductase